MVFNFSMCWMWLQEQTWVGLSEKRQAHTDTQKSWHRVNLVLWWRNLSHSETWHIYYIEIPKCIWMYKITWIAKEILEIKNNTRVITIPNFILYYKVKVTRNSMGLTQKRPRRSKEYIIDDPEPKQHSYTHLSFDTDIKRHWRKGQPL